MCLTSARNRHKGDIAHSPCVLPPFQNNPDHGSSAFLCSCVRTHVALVLQSTVCTVASDAAQEISNLQESSEKNVAIICMFVRQSPPLPLLYTRKPRLSFCLHLFCSATTCVLQPRALSFFLTPLSRSYPVKCMKNQRSIVVDQVLRDFTASQCK